MANGKVVTGFSKPYVALYDSNNGSPLYTSGMALARGVSASLSTESGDGVNFYADNITAESTGGIFTGATENKRSNSPTDKNRYERHPTVNQNKFNPSKTFNKNKSFYNNNNKNIYSKSIGKQKSFMEKNRSRSNN